MSAWPKENKEEAEGARVTRSGIASNGLYGIVSNL